MRSGSASHEQPPAGCTFQVTSLFCGAGGIDAGFESTSAFKTVVANDIRKAAVETFSTNFRLPIVVGGGAIRCAGVYLASIEEIEFDGLPVSVQPDVLIGGPPCQDFSVVRGPTSEREGIGVRRGRLYTHFVRALASLQPKVFVFENVPGLISANAGKAYKRIISDFQNLTTHWDEIKSEVGPARAKAPHGYAIVFAGIVDASKLGVPQARRRLIVIGLRRDCLHGNIRIVAEFAKHQLSGASSLLRKYPLTPIEVFEGQTLANLQNKYDTIAEEWKDKSNMSDIIHDYLSVNCIPDANFNEIDDALEEHERVLRELGYFGRPIEGMSFSDGSNVVAKERPSVVSRMQQIPPGYNHECVKGTEWEVEGRGMSLIYKRIHPLKPAYTVVAFGGGGTWGYHYARGRSKLTNRERARLQSFPDNFLFKGTVQQIRSQIGEAVPPLLAKHVAIVCHFALDQSCAR